MAKATKALTKRRSYVGRKRYHKRAGFTLPLAAVAGFTPLIANTINRWKKDGYESGLASIGQGLTGYNYQSGKWKFSNLGEGLLPIMGGLLVHKLASKLGINRMLGQAKVPFIRI